MDLSNKLPFGVNQVTNLLLEDIGLTSIPENINQYTNLRFLDLSLNKIEYSEIEKIENILIIRIGGNQCYFIKIDDYGTFRLWSNILSPYEFRLCFTPNYNSKNLAKNETVTKLFETTEFYQQFDIKFNIENNVIEATLKSGHLEFLPGVITQFKNLSGLNLSGNKFDINKITDLKSFSKLTQLDLSKNITGKILKQDIFVHLKFLNLSENQIESIENDVIKMFHNLEVLDLSKNKLKKFETMDSLGKLKLLNLAGNIIDNISFKSLPNLKILDLSFNQLKEIKSNSFKNKHLKALIFLNLDDNKIKKICKDSFIDFDNLRYLNLLNNQLAKVEKEAFNRVPKLIKKPIPEMKDAKKIDEFIKIIPRYDKTIYSYRTLFIIKHS